MDGAGIGSFFNTSFQPLILEPAPSNKTKISKIHFPKPIGSVAVKLSSKKIAAPSKHAPPKAIRIIGTIFFFIVASDDFPTWKV